MSTMTALRISPLAILLCVAPVQSQVLDVLNSSTAANDAQPSNSPSVPESLDQIESRQKEFRKAVGFPPPQPVESEEADPNETRLSRIIYQIDSTYAEQRIKYAQLKELEEQLESIGPPPTWKEVSSIGDLNAAAISLSQLDQLHGINTQLEENLILAQQEIIRAGRKLDVARKAYNRMDSERASDDGDTGLKEQLIQRTRQADEETYILRQIEARAASLKRDLLTVKVDRFKPFLLSFMDKVQIDEDEIKKKSEAFQNEDEELESSLSQAQDKASRTVRAYEEFKSTLTDAPTPLQSARLLALDSQRQAAQARVSLNQSWINHHNLKRELTRDRYKFLRVELDRAAMISTEERLRPEIERLATEVEFLENEHNQTEKKLAQRKQHLEADDSERNRYLQQAANATLDHLQIIQEEIYSTKAALALARTFLRELQTKTKRIDMAAVKIRIGNFMAYVWDYELFRLNENRFTIATLVWVTLSLIGAYLAALGIAFLIGRVIFPRLGFGAGGAAALQKLSFYFFLVIGIVVVFASFGFPLSSLTVASGILALAVGFGSQEILKNFISGIILLIERPIHQGDVIELDNRVLTVESIGARSTRMRDFDSTEKIIPNSYLIENIVTNRTLSDDGIRTTVEVGVAYGSPTRKTSELLMEATTSVERVHELPQPFVVFSGFGDNALGFTVYFWTNADSILTVSSEVRHRIIEVLNEADIVIAFPQRDIHLDSIRPIQVEVTREPRPENEKAV